MQILYRSKLFSDFFMQMYWLNARPEEFVWRRLYFRIENGDRVSKEISGNQVLEKAIPISYIRTIIQQQTRLQNATMVNQISSKMFSETAGRLV